MEEWRGRKKAGRLLMMNGFCLAGANGRDSVERDGCWLIDLSFCSDALKLVDLMKLEGKPRKNARNLAYLLVEIVGKI